MGTWDAKGGTRVDARGETRVDARGGTRVDAGTYGPCTRERGDVKYRGYGR